MAHVAKYTSVATGPMLSHYDRSKENLSKNINKERTQLNYNLAKNLQPLKQIEFIKKRLSQVKVQKRADVNVLCDWVVTKPKDVTTEEEKIFFEETFNFLSNRYGKENVVSAYVHLDETTPHIHFAFIPITHTFKKSKKNPEQVTEVWKVSAKEVITRKDLRSFHSDLQNHLEKQLGHNVSIQNDATKNGNKAINELKRQTALENVKKAEFELQTVRDSIQALNVEYNARKTFINEVDKSSQLSVEIPEYAKVKKRFGKDYITVPAEKWKEKFISANQKEYINAAYEQFDKDLSDLRRTTSAQYVNSLKYKIDELKEKLNSKEDYAIQNYGLKMQVSELKKELANKDKEYIKKINTVLSKLPEEQANNFARVWKNSERTHSRQQEFER